MYTEQIYKDSLCHFGIDGQKWGIRRFQNLDRTWTEEGKIRYGHKSEKSAERAARKAAVKKIKKNKRNRRILTDEELDSAIKRLQNEKKLRELTDQEINAGKLYTKDLLKDIGKKTIPIAVSAGVLYAGKSYLNKQNFNTGEFAEDVYSIFKAYMKKK